MKQELKWYLIIIAIDVSAVLIRTKSDFASISMFTLLRKYDTCRL